MPSFMIDPSGRKVLATRRRRGGGCHGARHLHWKGQGEGLEVLTCSVCGKVHGERLRCFRCEGFCEVFPCRVCQAGKEVTSDLLGDLPPPIEGDVQLACKGTEGLCCRCAEDARAGGSLP